MTEVQEKHFDYVLSVPALPAGKRINGLPLPLDADAPFELRSRALRVPYDVATGTQLGLGNIALRFKDSAQQYMQQDPVPQALEMAYFGQGGNPKPQFPPVAYPAQGVIYVDVVNFGLTTITGLTLYFRGVKKFQPGQRRRYTYPPKFSPLTFIYPQLVASLPVTTPTQGLRQTFVVKPDADFVLRALQAGVAGASPSTYEVFLTLRDEDLYPYSNAPVHVDVLCGNGFIGNVFPCPGSTFVSPVGPGASVPGLVFPEIYIPRNHVLYFDILRTDAAYANVAAVDFPIAFIGQKVFPL